MNDEKVRDRKEKKIDWWLAIMLPLATLGAVECYNHFQAGPFREWLVTPDVISELMIKEMIARRSTEIEMRAMELDKVSEEYANRERQRLKQK